MPARAGRESHARSARLDGTGLQPLRYDAARRSTRATSPGTERSTVISAADGSRRSKQHKKAPKLLRLSNSFNNLFACAETNL